MKTAGVSFSPSFFFKGKVHLVPFYFFLSQYSKCHWIVLSLGKSSDLRISLFSNFYLSDFGQLNLLELKFLPLYNENNNYLVKLF